MKLHEIKVSEGLVDPSILYTVAQIANSGITNGAQTVTLAKCIMAIRDGQIGIAVSVDGYLNTLFPEKALIDDIKALPKETAQRIAMVVCQILQAKNEQIARYVGPFITLDDFLLYATEASANE